MSYTDHTVLCGGCKCPVETGPDPQPDDQASCPQCGRSDRFDKVMDSVRAYAGELAAKHMAKTIAATARKSRFFKLEIKKRPQRSFDWVCTDLEL